MKILSIAKYIILRNLRDVNTMLIMCAMPLFLMFILGIAFDSMMGVDGNIELEDMHITYAIVGEQAQLSDNLASMMEELLPENSTYEQVTDTDEQLSKLQVNDLTAFMVIDENIQSITLYKNSVKNTTSSVLESALRGFVAKYNVVMEIAKTNPMALQEILSEKETTEYISKTGLSQRYQPSANDYYGVVMVALFALYGLLVPIETLIQDRHQGLAARISTSSLKPIEIFIGNVTGFVGVTSIRALIVVIGSIVLFKVNWGENPIYPFMLIFVFIVLTTSLGMVIGQIFKSESAAASVSHIFIVASAFLGGAYGSLDTIGIVGEIGKYFSAIWWVNTGIANQIYNNDYSSMNKAFIIFAIGTVIFLALSIMLSNSKEVHAND